jgi:DNA replication protein DnaC
LLKHPTYDQLYALGLHGMAKALLEIAAGGEADGLGHHEWLGLLLDREASWRQDKRLAGRLRVAKLRQQACVEDVDYRSPRGLDRALFQKLVEGEWINAHDNLALIGPTGVGKSWLATRHAGTTAQSSTSACPGCSRSLRWRAATVAIPGFCATSAAPTF